MADILNIGGEPIFDDRVKIETHTYNPYANTTFGHSDEIPISSIVGPVLDYDVLVSGGGVRVSDVTRGEGV